MAYGRARVPVRCRMVPGFRYFFIWLKKRAFTMGKMSLSRCFLPCLLLLFVPPPTESDIGADGLCTLLTFVPFTFGYV